MQGSERRASFLKPWLPLCSLDLADPALAQKFVSNTGVCDLNEALPALGDHFGMKTVG